MCKRLLAFLLSVSLTAGVVMLPAQAAENKESVITVEATETQTPQMQVPETQIPQTQIPQTEVPQTEVPETQAPETQAPETQAPETQAPETQAPETQAPETQAPETQAPQTELPEIQEGTIEAFVARLYRLLLLREPDVHGLAAWSEVLRSQKETGADVVAGFVFSNEFIGNGYDDLQYIELLYKAILGRKSDPEGLADWKSELDAGLSRACICAGFVGSREFDELCHSYNIITGKVKLNEPADLYPDLTKFVTRAYRLILSREPERAGLNAWVTQLYSGRNTGADIIRGFMDSDEFASKKLSDEEYISILYRAVLGREPDPIGLRNWLDVMAYEGATRQEVLKGFIESVEFTKICEQYGIERGTITIIRKYQNPEPYYQIQKSISLTGGGYNLDIGFEGLKVVWVKKALGLGNSVGLYGALYTANVAKHVKAVQKRHRLPQTGVVDIFTWKALGFSENDWYNLGAYVSPIKVNTDSTRQDHIEAMIQRAQEYLGTSYIIGASGKPGTGVDCSGLAMQSLYAAGIDMSPINPVRHAHPGYEYESANMWASPKFKHVPYSERQRGDLIFYQNSRGRVIHVAIYLGDDQVIEATCAPFDKVVIEPVKNKYRSNIKGVARPFV